MTNPSIAIQFKAKKVTIQFCEIELVPLSGTSSIEDSLSTGLVAFKNILPGSKKLLDDFKQALATSQSLEHWPVQAGTTYWDNLIYILDQVTPRYGMTYTVQNAPKKGKPKKVETGEFDILSILIK